MNKQNKPAGNHIWKSGDKARIVGNCNGHYFEIGETVKLACQSGLNWKARYLDGHDFWYVKECDIEPLENKPLRDWTLGEVQAECRESQCDETCRLWDTRKDTCSLEYSANEWDLTDQPRFTADEVENMLHCIGYTPQRAKRGKYTAFRNYFTTSGPESEWDDLVDKGLAESRAFPEGGSSAGRVYHVTRKGMGFLEGCLGGVKIMEDD